MEVAFLFFMWVGVYKSSPNGVDSVINGFTFKQMLTYVVFVNIFNFVSFGSDTMWFISDEIEKGTVALSFVKPISYRKRFIFTALGTTTVHMLMLGVPCFAIAYAIFSAVGYIQITSVWTLLLHIALFLVSQVLALLIMDCLNYICGVLCFYTTAGWGINAMKDVITQALSGSLIPLSFFPAWVGKVLNYSPFAGLSQNPVFILLMRIDALQALHCIGLSLVWWLAMEFVAGLIFKVASKKVTVQGG